MVKFYKLLFIQFLFVTTSYINAYCASGPPREDNSSIVVWVFLAFCALIVISQIFPLLRNLWSSRKIISEPEKQKVNR